MLGVTTNRRKPGADACPIPLSPQLPQTALTRRPFGLGAISRHGRLLGTAAHAMADHVAAGGADIRQANVIWFLLVRYVYKPHCSLLLRSNQPQAPPRSFFFFFFDDFRYQYAWIRSLWKFQGLALSSFMFSFSFLFLKNLCKWSRSLAPKKKGTLGGKPLHCKVHVLVEVVRVAVQRAPAVRKDPFPQDIH